MKIDDIEIGRRYLVNWYGDLLLCECINVDLESGGGWAEFIEPNGDQRAFSARAVEDYVIRPDIPRRSVEELEDYAESTSREAHREPESDGGFECVWRVRCTNVERHGVYGYIGPHALDACHPDDAHTYETESAALEAAESAGWYVDAEQALCPECRDEMEVQDGN